MFCPLCKASEIRYLFLKDTASFMGCSKCGFEFAKVSINANLQSLIEDYDELYLQYFENNVADEKNFQSELKWIGKHVDVTDARILDVGCGSGKFVRYLRSNAIDASGIEPSRVLFDRYLSGDNFFKNRTVECLSAEAGKPWTVITVRDVIEHVEDPRSFLEALSKILTGDGWIFIVTPDVGSLTARILGRHWHFYHKYHLSYFSKKTFSQLCEMHGFDVKFRGQTKVYFPTGHVIRYVSRLISQRSLEPIARKFDRLCLPLITGDRFGVCLRKK